MVSIINNGKITSSGGWITAFEHPNQGDGYRLRAYMDSVKGFVEQGLVAPLMGDAAWSKALLICRYAFLKLYWTGTDQISYANMDTIAKLVYSDSNQSLNAGKGPAFSCAAVADVTRSIMSAYGIQVMRLDGASHGTGEDVAMAAFIPEFGKWIWMQPFSLSYVLMSDGTPGSPVEIESYYRRGLVSELTYKSGTEVIETDTGYDKYHITSGHWWQGTQEGDLENGGYFYKCYYWHIYSKKPIPSTSTIYDLLSPQLYIQGKVARNTICFPASIDDIFPTVNMVAITAFDTSNGVIAIKFAHNMPSFKLIQKSTDGLAWSSLMGLSDAIDNTGTGNMYYRAVSMQGVPSNVITIEY